MNTYGWMLLGQTLLALVALGLCGGWVVWPFRRKERPYLWLAAPLAGLFTLGGSLTLLYFGARLPFRSCLWVGFALNAGATVACLVRGRGALPSLWNRTAATVVVLGAAYWATVSCNKTAIDAREPTIGVLDGSDMYGYAITSDWLRAHEPDRPPRRDEPFEVMIHANLFMEGARPVSFMLVAAAGEARGTSSLFSYDWAAGVILAAAMLGFGAAFAPNALVLVLLAAGGGTSAWLADGRSGYIAKTIAYPGSLLAAGLFLTAAGQFTWRRLAALAALTFAVAYSIAPVVVAVVMGMAAGCLLVALALVYPLDRLRDRGASFRSAVLKPGLLALAVWVAAAGPPFATHYSARDRVAVPQVPLGWPVVIPVALDLEPPVLPLLKPQTEEKLLYGCFALLLAQAGAALLLRRPAALALTGCGAAVPTAWLLDVPLVHSFHGLIYPLTLAGAALLAAPRARAAPSADAAPEPARSDSAPPGAAPRAGRAWGAARVALAVVLVAVGVGLRVPQVRATADRYLYTAHPFHTVHRASEANALRAAVSAGSVDVTVGHFTDSHLVLAELVARGVPVHLRPPAWDRSLRNWARYAGCPEPDMLAPKSRFTLMEKNAYAPPGTERWVGSRLKLVEDRGAVTVLGVADTQEMSWDLEWRPGVWVGNTPTTFLVHNGTGKEQPVRLCGVTSAGPARPDRDRTLVWRLGEQTGKLPVSAENTAAIPLLLAPGLNRVELSVAEPADPPPPPKYPVALLNFRNWRIEPAGP